MRKIVAKLDGAIIKGSNKAAQLFLKKRDGLDGLLVTVGLCIIALLLCVVMKDSLITFITTIVTSLQNKAIQILG